MTPTAEQSLREAISAEKLEYTEVWGTVTETARDLARAISSRDFEEVTRAAGYIRDVTQWLQRGGLSR